MPRYYCDYCDTYLTHDSPSVRKQHNAGYKHKANVRQYYQQFEQQQTQSLIDQKIKEHLDLTGFYQVGAAFNQHLAALPGLQRPRPPILPPLPVPGVAMVPGLRPPVLLRPGVPGYGVPPQMAPVPGQQLTASTLPMQMNGLPGPPIMNVPGSSGAPPGIVQAPYQPPNPAVVGPPPASAPERYSYAQAPETGS